MPGEGDGQVVQSSCQDLKDRGYGDGYISIEPHVAAVFHDADGDAEKDPEAQAKWLYESYVEYGEKMGRG